VVAGPGAGFRRVVTLRFRPDVDEVIARWKLFWDGDSPRPLLHAVRPRPGATPVEPPNPYDCAFGDLDEVAEQLSGWVSTHEFLGDAIPFFMVTLAPDHFAALLGAEIVNSGSGRTNWIEPCIDDLRDADLRFRRDGRWWLRTVECIERFREQFDDQLIVVGTHFQGSLDCLAAMYGTQKLLMDMVSRPDLVLQALDQVRDALAEARIALADLLDVSTRGSLNRFGMYSPGIIDVPQCDLSCMISREMFDSIELPYLAHEISTTESSVYHLDGVDAILHLESICSINDLDVIQWMPGEGYYDDDWSDLNRKIDALGKGQIFQPYYQFSAEDIASVWETYTSRKLFFHVNTETLAELPWE
jgi:hypothetical protein